jgi:hypothetical protein
MFLSIVAPAQAAKKPFLLGVVDDASAFQNDNQRAAISKLGLNAIRAVVHWKPGKSAGTVKLDGPPNVRVIVSVLAAASKAPTTPSSRAEYCSFLVELAQANPRVRDLIIWNEPGTRSYFWPSNNSVEHYIALLAECYDTLHSQVPNVRVIGPAAHVPLPEMLLFVRAMAEAAIQRGAPIVDVFAIHPYDLVGQTRAVIAMLNREWAYTPQPNPLAGLPIWYTEHGVQSIPLWGTPKRDLYVGDPDKGVTEAEQANFVKRNIAAAYCIPEVSGYFNFLMRDEVNLTWHENSAGFQSGLLYPDWTTKPAFIAMHSLARQIKRGTVKC